MELRLAARRRGGAPRAAGGRATGACHKLLQLIAAATAVPAPRLRVRVGFPPRALSAADLGALADGETLIVDRLEGAAAAPAAVEPAAVTAAVEPAAAAAGGDDQHARGGPPRTRR